METLFPIESNYPEGFSYYPQFISIEEEKFLINLISGIELHNFQFHGYEAKRKVASFGYDYSFEKKALSKGKAIPGEFNFLIEKVCQQAGIKTTDIAELLVTEYPTGSVINWHRDAPPFDLIAGISLYADCILKLRPHEKEKQGRNSVVSIPLIKRSLYLLQGKVRSDWQHSTAPVKNKRYSITLRTLRTH